MRHHSLLFSVFILLSGCFAGFWTTPSHGAIYQCKDSDGRSVFSDQPCGGGVNKKLPDYEVKFEPYVSGRFTLADKSFPVRQGMALWDKESATLQLVLTMHPLSETEKQQALTDDWSFLDNHKARGLTRLYLTLNKPAIELANVKTMNVEIHTLEAGKATVEKATLGGEDIVGHINRLQTSQKDGTLWLEFNTQEFKPDLRWNVSLILPLK